MSEKKQKILIVHNYYQIPGGEDTVVANEKKMLEEQGHEVLLYTKHNAELKKMTKIQKVLLPFSIVFNVSTYREVKRIIIEKQIDVLHVHNTLSLVSPSVYYAGFSEKIPVVQTIHNFRLLCPGATFFRNGDICEECLQKGLICSVKHKCYRDSRIQTLACAISTWIHRMLGTYRRLNYICLTEFNKEKLLHLKQIRESSVFVKPNFVNSNGERILKYEQRKNQFVYVGRLDKLKGIDILLKAWKQVESKSDRLIVCGTGPMEEWCKAFVEENKLNNVELKGFVENEKVRKIIGESKALILPTQWYEGFPMTIAESFSVGTPVIGSDIGNTADLIEQGKNGLKFNQTSAQSLAETVMNFQKNPIELDEKIIDRYSVEKNYILLKMIYDKSC